MMLPSTVSTHPHLAITEPLQVDHIALRAMAQDARDAFPNECCGFMFGRSRTDVREVLRILPVENRVSENAPRRFEISPRDYLRAERLALELNLELIGVYHSHPLHPAIPSSHDLAVALPAFSYVILSAFEDVIVSVRSWKLNEEGTFSEESILHI